MYTLTGDFKISHTTRGSKEFSFEEIALLTKVDLEQVLKALEIEDLEWFPSCYEKEIRYKVSPTASLNFVQEDQVKETTAPLQSSFQDESLRTTGYLFRGRIAIARAMFQGSEIITEGKVNLALREFYKFSSEKKEIHEYGIYAVWKHQGEKREDLQRVATKMESIERRLSKLYLPQLQDSDLQVRKRRVKNI